MKQNRADRIMAALNDMELTQMLIVDPMSIYYLTGVFVAPFERFYGLLLRADGKHAFFRIDCSLCRKRLAWKKCGIRIRIRRRRL